MRLILSSNTPVWGHRFNTIRRDEKMAIARRPWRAKAVAESAGRLRHTRDPKDNEEDGSSFLPCNLHTSARHNGIRMPCHRRRGIKPGHCCRTLQLNKKKNRVTLKIQRVGSVHSRSGLENWTANEKQMGFLNFKIQIQVHEFILIWNRIFAKEIFVIFTFRSNCAARKINYLYLLTLELDLVMTRRALEFNIISNRNIFKGIVIDPWPVYLA